MKRANLLVITLFFVAIFLSPSTAYSQTLPDYTNWQVAESGERSAVINGQATKLTFTLYHNLDEQNQIHRDVNILNNNNNLPWLALFTRESRDTAGNISRNFALFENINKQWVLVRDLSKSNNQNELFELLKERYNLEFQ